MDASTTMVCPICLAASSPDEETGSGESPSGPLASTTAAAGAIIFARTPCGHVFCKECIERVMINPRGGGSTIPTRAPCPMCRETVSLFDLTRADGAANSLVYDAAETYMSSWPVANSRYTQRSMIQIQDANAVLEGVIDAKGAIEGYGIEFDFRGPAPSMGFRKPLKIALDCDWDEAGHNDDNHMQTLDSIAFDRAYFHAPSMTFRGRVSFVNPAFDDEEYFYEELDCLLHFSGGAHYVRMGELRWKLASSTPNPNGAVRFPLDGTWEVQYSVGGSTNIHVQKHFFSCFGATYRIALDEDGRPRLTGDDGTVQTTDQQMHPGSSGPDVGETLDWTSTSARNERIVWKRLATTLDDCWRSFRIVSGNFVYQKCNPHPGNDLLLGPSYQANKLWGNTFCQLYSVGLASYHFLEPDSDGNLSAYISYESPKTEVWPPLDNGERVPSHVPFRNISFDSETRTFRGDVCWEEDHGTTWVGEPKWSFEMVFDPSFTFVASGTCSRARSETNQFGVDLIYINAAIEMRLRMALASRTTGDYINILRQWRNDGATSNTLNKLGEVAIAVMDRRESIIDFNL